MLIAARLAGWRASPAVVPRLAVIAGFAAVAYFIARGTAAHAAAEVVALALAVLCAAIVGFPFGAAAALLMGSAVYAGLVGAHDPAAISGAAAVTLTGLLLSTVFAGGRVAQGEAELGYDGQPAFAGNGRVALPRGEGSMQSGISMLASGVREVSQGDFTKNLADRKSVV